MNGFTIYKEYYDLITLLNEEEQKELLLAITKFMFEDIEPVLNDKQIKMFNNLRRPLEKSKKRSKSGSTNKTKQNQNENKTETKQNQNENDNVNSLEKIGCGEEKSLRQIVDYLNEKTGSHFKYSSKTTQMKINARLNEGYKLDDFIAVIDKKYAEWFGTEYEKYLCPETLFGTKFEKYLNQKVTCFEENFKEFTEEEKAILRYDWLNE